MKLKSLMIASVLAAASPLALAPALAAETATPAAKEAVYSSETDMGTLLDNPQTKAILDKYIHDMVSNPQIAMARSMTLRQLQAYASEALTDENLTKIDMELAKVPAAK
jgi:hypothetical protein